MRLYAIPAIAFLSACTLQPRYLRPAAPVAAHYPAFGAAKPEETGWRDFFAERSRIPESVSPTGQSMTRGQYSIGAGIAWEIDFFGKLHSLKDAALAAYL